MTGSSPRVSLDCYVRATAAGEPPDEFLETVHAYDEEGLLDEWGVEHWPDEIGLTADTEAGSVLAHYRKFRAWADEEGVSLEPAFRRRERTTLVSDDSDAVLVLPVLCLAVRVDGALVQVAPHTAGTTTYTVADALADLQSFPRTRSTDVSELPPDHPVRSALQARAVEDSPTPDTGDATPLEQ